MVGCQQGEGHEDQGKENSPGIDYQFDHQNRTAKVKGFIGDYPKSIDIPSTTCYEGVDYRVTSIGDYAFSGYGSLTDIVIPEEVITIGLAAFENCSNLTSVICWATIPPTIQANSFEGVNDSISIHVPEEAVKKYQSAKYWKELANIRAIVEGTCGDNLTWRILNGNELIIEGTGAMDDFNSYSAPWYNYRNLIQDITLPEGVTSIGEYAFYECSSLTAITIPEGVTWIGNSAFYGCSSLTAITIPESVTSIGEWAFEGCSSLTTITIPEGVTSIGWGAFYGCSSLTSITLPEGVTSIEGYAFTECRSLTAITIPESVTSIGSSAFSGCSSLTSITIPEGVTSIGERAFCYCTSLTSITIPKSVTSIGYSAFSGCSSLTAITFPENSQLTSIGEGAFNGCWSLTTITLPEGVTSIGREAFRNCSSLTAITLPKGVTYIGNDTFSDCSKLTDINIPEDVKWIGAYAFSGCSSLTTITCKAMTPPTIYNASFYDCYNATLYVPAAAVSTYRETYPWNYFENIQGI